MYFGKMKLLDAEDSACRFHGHGFQVVFYCHTCHTLLCPRCLTKGQLATSTDHMSHVYLDIKEAVDIVKDDLEKIVQRIRDEVEQRKVIKMKLQTRLQALKLELLRQKTVLDRRILCMKNTIRKKRLDFQDCLSRLIQPPVDAIQSQLNCIESDVISGLDLLHAAESLQWQSDNQSLGFLRAFSRLKSVLQLSSGEQLLDQPGGDPHDKVDQELIELSHLDMTFKRELNLLGQAFLFPQKVPSSPKILRSWCTIGSRSASIYWISDSNISSVKSFLLYYQPVPLDHDDIPSRTVLSSMDHAALCNGGFHCIRIRRFLPKRSQAVLRNLTPNTTYILIIFSTNCFARSLPCISYLQTLETRNEFVTDCIPPNASKRQTANTHVSSLFTRVIQLLVLFLMLFYFFISAIVITVHWNDLSKDACLFFSMYMWKGLPVLCKLCNQNFVAFTCSKVNETAKEQMLLGKRAMALGLGALNYWCVNCL